MRTENNFDIIRRYMFDEESGIQLNNQTKPLHYQYHYKP